MKTIQYEDIIKINNLKLATISGDGTAIAFVVEKADIKKNCLFHILFLWNKDSLSTQKLLTCDKVRVIKWNKNVLYILTQQEKKYNIFRIDSNREIIKLVSSAKPITIFTVTSTGDYLYYSQTISASKARLKKIKEEGYVYQWGHDTLTTLINKQYSHYEYEKILCHDILSGKKRFLTKFSYENWSPKMPLIIAMDLSPGEDYLAININRVGKPELGKNSFLQDLFVYEIQKNKIYKLISEHLFSKIHPCWINNHELVFQNANYITMNFTFWKWDAKNNISKRLNLEINDHVVYSLAWNEEKNAVIAKCDKFLYQISLDSGSFEKIKIPEGMLREDYNEYPFSWDKSYRFFATTLEDRNFPPEVILHDLQENKTTTITDINSNAKSLALGEIEPIFIKTEEGLSTDGYLLHPINRAARDRCPLIIATYGFKGQACSANANEWHSSFPAQIFAREGYYVLLLNDVKSYSQAYIGKQKKARNEEGWDVLKIFEHAVTVMDERELIDPNKVALYGWSHGAFIVEFLISHSNKFQAACIGEGGDYNPGCFWLYGMEQWTKIFTNVFGGPPWGNTLKNYLDFSPFFQVANIRTPLLMEFAQTTAFCGFEMYVPLRYLNVPAELVVYDNEEHIFINPKARIASMARKVDWFNYWLLNKYDLSKPEQYSRWDEMRDNYKRNVK